MNKYTIILKITAFISVLVGVVFLFFRGQPKAEFTTQEYLTWLGENKEQLIQESELDNFDYTVRYLPAEYVILKYNDHFDFNSKQGQQELAAYNKSIYFSYEVKSKSGKDPLHELSRNTLDYHDKLKYYSFDAQNDFKLIQGKDTLDCKLYHMERTYNTAPIMRVSLVFEKPKEFTQQDFILSFNDQKQANGRMNYYYSIDQINNLPTIKNP